LFFRIYIERGVGFTAKRGTVYKVRCFHAGEGVVSGVVKASGKGRVARW